MLFAMEATYPWHGVTLCSPDELLAEHTDLFGTSPSARLQALAEAITSSDLWGELRSRLRLAIRPEPTPMLAVLGDPLPSDHDALHAMGWQVADALRRLRPVTYRQAEIASEVLADKVRAHLGLRELTRTRFVGLPRGGLIVAGMVAYFLGLDHHQLLAPATPEDVTVVLDDCMLSGTQLRRWIRRYPSSGRVVAAHLHSHPDLRRAVEAAEPNVERCIAAADLTNHATARIDHLEWQSRWRDRTPEAYWIGDPDHVCYPWNEPDALIWDVAAETARTGWRVVPPSWCIKNRAQRRAGPDDIAVCIAPSGPVRPADDVLWIERDADVLVVAAGSGVSLHLTGVAAAMWRALCRIGDLDDAANTILSEYKGGSAAQVLGDLRKFHSTLSQRALLT